MSENKDLFISAVHQNIFRNGVPGLMSWLETTDFYTAPASTRYHGSYEGGLVEHSLAVFNQLQMLTKVYDNDSSSESIAIVSLFHDLCKADSYKTEMRWRKNAQDKWEQYPVYTFNEDFAYGGHGAKSVYLIQSFMPLFPDEAAAINSHMGQWDATTYSNPTAVYERNQLAWLLHVADEAADFIIGK